MWLRPGGAMAEKSARQHIIGLDLLRLFAAMLVMAYHFAFWHWTRGQDTLRRVLGEAPSWGQSLHFGWVGVEIFFVISGFVIAYSSSSVTSSAFFQSRFLRLVPASLVCSTLTFLLMLFVLKAEPHSLALDYVATLVFWPFRSIGSVYWTLGIEIDFYLFVYLLLRFDRLAWLEPIILTVIGLASGCFWIAALSLDYLLRDATGLLGSLHFLVLKAEGNRFLQLFLVQHGCLFGFGVVLWRASATRLSNGRILALAGLAGACLIEIVGQNTIVERASGLQLSPIPAMLMWITAVTVFVAAIAFNDTLVWKLRNRTGMVRFMGLMTYPLYLVHNAIGLSVTVLLAPMLGYFAVVIGVMAALAGASWIAYVIEPRVRHTLKNVIWTRQPM
jgi:peptidoglycan/LPS O-acetylase OafA/YrhL